MQKIDYKKELKHLYKTSVKQVEMVEVPAMNFLMIDGQGEPNTSQDFSDAVEALYATAYTLKFIIKKWAQQLYYGVIPLEGLWWVDDMSQFDINDKSSWYWTTMIMQPECITEDLVVQACEQVAIKKSLLALPKLRFAPFLCRGHLRPDYHRGPFSEEGPTIQRVHNFISENGYTRQGKHHEIYLSDIRRAAPENWKTVIRQPMCKG